MLLSILAILSFLSQIIGIRIEKHNNDLLPINFGSNFQLPDLIPVTNSNPERISALPELHQGNFTNTHPTEPTRSLRETALQRFRNPGPGLSEALSRVLGRIQSHRADLLRRRVPLERITREQPNHRRSAKSRYRTWNPGLNTQHQFYNPVLQELNTLRRNTGDFDPPLGPVFGERRNGTWNQEVLFRPPIRTDTALLHSHEDEHQLEPVE